jgi:ankyrin repeat protein
MTQALPRRMSLLHCLRDGQEHLVRPLLALGLSIDVQDAEGNTPLHAAASARQAAVLKALVSNAADPSVRNKKGRTLLHVLRDGQEHLVRPLLAHGLGIDVRDASGNTPLHTAAAGGQADVLRLLVMNSADPSLRNHRGRDALLCAVCSKVNTLVRNPHPRCCAMLRVHVHACMCLCAAGEQAWSLCAACVGTV